MAVSPATNYLDSGGMPGPQAPPPILPDDVLRQLNPGGAQPAPATPTATPAVNGVGRPPTGIAAGPGAPSIAPGAPQQATWPSNVRQQVVGFWQQQGVPQHVAEGIADAIQPESGFRPAAFNPNDNGAPSGGLYQHHADRFQRLQQFAAQRGKSWTDPLIQNQFANWEARQGGDPIASQHWNEIAQAPDRATAKALWQKYFERGELQGGAGGSPDGLDSLRQAGRTVQQGLYRSAAAEAARANEAIRKIGAFGPEIDKSMAEVHRARERSDAAMTKATESLSKQPQPPDIDGIKNMGGIATIVGILGGMLTKQPMIASLNAASAAIGAYNDGDREKYDLAFKNWKTQNDLLFKIAEMQSTRAKDIMSDEKMGLEERRVALDLYLRASGQQALADKLRVEGDKAGFDYVQAVENALEKRREFDIRIAETHERNVADLDKDPAAAAYKRWTQEYVSKNKHYPSQEEASAAWKQSLKDFPKEKAPSASVILTDPTKKDDAGNPIQYVYRPDTHEATTLGGEPYTPGGAQRMTSGGITNAVKLTEEAKTQIAERVLAGDHSAAQGLGYGTVGANNRTEVNNMVAKLGRERGMTGQQIAAKQLEFAGRRAEMQTIGRYQAAIEQAVVEAKSLIPQVLRTSEAVPRTELLDLNRALMAGRTHTGDPRTVQFGIAVNSFIQMYGRALNPRGTPHVADVEHARELLQTGFSKGQVRAAMEQLQFEMDTARNATDDVWDQILARAGGESRPTAPALMKSMGISAPHPEVFPAPPAAAVKDLKASPDTKDQFDEIFGPGAADRVLGQ